MLNNGISILSKMIIDLNENFKTFRFENKNQSKKIYETNEKIIKIMNEIHINKTQHKNEIQNILEKLNNLYLDNQIMKKYLQIENEMQILQEDIINCKNELNILKDKYLTIKK